MTTSVGIDSRRNSDTFVRFRNAHEGLPWSAVDSLECDVNAVVHRGRFAENDDRMQGSTPSGKFTGTLHKKL